MYGDIEGGDITVKRGVGGGRCKGSKGDDVGELGSRVQLSRCLRASLPPHLR